MDGLESRAVNIRRRYCRRAWSFLPAVRQTPTAFWEHRELSIIFIRRSMGHESMMLYDRTTP